MRRALAGSLLALALITTTAHAEGLLDLTPYIDNAESGGATTSSAASLVDLLYESNSYTPPFYRGRALPSPGSTMHFQAIPHFGIPADSASITYTWRRNGRVEGSISGAGRSDASIPAPTLFGTDIISVDAKTAEGAHGFASVTISSTDPRPALYQDHPLFGIEYYNALLNKSSISDSEMTFAAVPYFAPSSTLGNQQLSWSWSINGQPLAKTGASSQITLSAQNSTGLATLAVSVTSLFNPLLYAQGSWELLFARNGFSAQQTNQ